MLPEASLEVIFEVTFQTASQILLAFGIILSAFGGFGSYFFGKINQAETQSKSDEIQRDLKAQIVKLQATFDAKTDLIFQALKVKEDVWIAVNTNTVPPGVTEYLLLIFKSDRDVSAERSEYRALITLPRSPHLLMTLCQLLSPICGCLRNTNTRYRPWSSLQ
jgi:hypothetical protein